MKVNIDPTAPTFATYRRDMRAEQMAEDYPVVSIDSDALDAARMLAEHRLPGLLVTAGQANGMRYSLPHRSCASSCPAMCKTIPYWPVCSTNRRPTGAPRD